MLPACCLNLGSELHLRQPVFPLTSAGVATGPLASSLHVLPPELVGAVFRGVQASASGADAAGSVGGRGDPKAGAGAHFEELNVGGDFLFGA